MYKSMLCLVALNDEARKVVTHAAKLAELHGADLYLMHVVEYVPLTGTEDAMLAAPIDISDELETRARNHLAELAKLVSVPNERCQVVTGDLAIEVQTTAESSGIDLVVVGNHTRRGLGTLFNHAEDTVLHRCPCDLLAVHLD